MKSPVEKFAKESDLCAAFIASIPVERRGPIWTAYAETAGFDILLVRECDGAQIGVEAKLRLNNKVVAQALPHISQWDAAERGPDYRAVLVPAYACDNDLQPICAALGVTVISVFKSPTYRPNRASYSFSPDLPSDVYGDRGWHQWAPLKRCAVPDYVPDVAAGASAPVALTHWKIAAIKLAILLQRRPVTRADFKALALSPSRWTDPYSGWLTRTAEGYVAGPRIPDFKAQHPTNFDQIAADFDKWGANLRHVRPAQMVMDVFQNGSEESTEA